jgi:hypothetical protein
VPFIKQHYLSHLKQHAETWEEYKELSVDSKKVYFNGKIKCANTMHMYIDTNQDSIHFTISLPIVDVIIKELFYYDEDKILASIDEIEEEDEEDHHMDMQWIHKKVEKEIALKRNTMKLIMDMNGEMCPKKTNRWAHLDNALKFYISCQHKIIEHTDAHAHFESPSTKWWTITLVIASAINEINKTVVQLQN